MVGFVIYLLMGFYHFAYLHAGGWNRYRIGFRSRGFIFVWYRTRPSLEFCLGPLWLFYHPSGPTQCGTLSWMSAGKSFWVGIKSRKKFYTICHF